MSSETLLIAGCPQAGTANITKEDAERALILAHSALCELNIEGAVGLCDVLQETAEFDEFPVRQWSRIDIEGMYFAVSKQVLCWFLPVRFLQVLQYVGDSLPEKNTVSALFVPFNVIDVVAVPYPAGETNWIYRKLLAGDSLDSLKEDLLRAGAVCLGK